LAAGGAIDLKIATNARPIQMVFAKPRLGIKPKTWAVELARVAPVIRNELQQFRLQFVGQLVPMDFARMTRPQQLRDGWILGQRSQFRIGLNFGKRSGRCRLHERWISHVQATHATPAAVQYRKPSLRTPAFMVGRLVHTQHIFGVGPSFRKGLAARLIESARP
jgi:hypothetical protein